MDHRVAAEGVVLTFEFGKGNDRGPYLNFSFTAHNHSLPKVWRLVKRRVLGYRSLGDLLRRSCIVTCVGFRGWDNYLLLHHFNPKVPLEELRIRSV